ncbi:hypothetical protein [Zobellia uliginosa]|uniref:hypothetical protein n=1 Tax=Zobellia uliginosa TaxID=143224 RepID=UPI0026E317F2|nr:hypothetical protein [Zobellia uliginosa]MDO6519384.1 hypothetical protein [Zobellia uliginosa]
MNFKSILNTDENIELEVVPKKGIMLHANDLFKIIFGIFFLTIAFGIGFTKHFGFLILGIVGFGYMLNAIYIRYNNTNGIKYLISNKRVIFLKNGDIIKQKKIEDIKEVTYENSGNDTGYIILGEIEPLIAGRGISFSEDKYVLDNLTNYKEVSELLKKLIGK